MPVSSTEHQPVVLVENGPAVSVSLERHEIQELTSLNAAWRARLGLARDPFLYELGTLSARDVTGFVQAGVQSIEVAPKFLTDGLAADSNWRPAIWAILARTYRVPVLSAQSTGTVTKEHFLPDLLGYILLASVRTATLHGSPSGYVEDFDLVPVLKGRILPARILDSVIHPGLLPCAFEEFSKDVPANRLVKWAAEQLSHLVRSPLLGRELMEEALAMRDVASTPPPPQTADRISLSPNSQFLAPAVRVGQLLLGSRNLRHGTSEEKLPGFLWKSSDVFERFVKVLIRRSTSLLPGNTRFLDSALILGEPAPIGRRLHTTPDIRLVGSGAHVAVLDAKYKVWSGSPAAHDSYQVVAGGWVAGSDDVGLIYPSPGLDRKYPLSWTLTGQPPPRRLWACFIDLIRMAEPRGEARLIVDLARDINLLCSSGLGHITVRQGPV